MSIIDYNYYSKCLNISDIYEHLPTLLKYAEECKHITELGVRDVVSTYALAKGLKNRVDNRLIIVDIIRNEKINNILDECKDENINIIFYNESDLTCPIENTELLFIDTWHIYGQLKKEFTRWNKYVNKYIILPYII
jgi:hypothetical protein